MKSLPVALACVLLLVQPLFAQNAADSLPAVQLIPEEVPQIDKPRGTAIDKPAGGGFKKTKTDASAEELRDRIRFREAKTKALRDAQVQAQWQLAEDAKTEYDRREALKGYYKQLYTRMARFDGSLKKLIDERRQLALRRLEQTRIDPTQPLRALE